MSFLMGSRTHQRCMNPLASVVFFVLEDTVKCLARECVVSLFKGMGGRDGLCCGGGPWAHSGWTYNCTPKKTTKAIARDDTVRLLFIAHILFVKVVAEEDKHTFLKSTKRIVIWNRSKVNKR